MPDTSIMDMVNNTYELYQEKTALFDRWVEMGDRWTKERARGEALHLAGGFARAVEKLLRDMGDRSRYHAPDVEEAATEMLEEFEEYRDYAIKKAVENATRVPKPEDLRMDEGDVEHAKKYDVIAREIGIPKLLEIMPATQEKIQKALEHGDKHLNSIPLRKWDAAAEYIRSPRRLSLSEKVSALKHVAKFYYA